MAAPVRIGASALATLLPDLRALPGPVYLALARALSALVLDGRIAVETRLPSERDLAVALRLSRATVTSAYDQLRTDGYLESRIGSGSFVTVPPTASPNNLLTRWTVRTSARPEGIIDLTCAALPAPPALIEPALAAAAGSLGPHLLDNGYDPAGLPGVRRAVAERFTRRGVPTSPEQILMTNGAQHAVDLLLRLLIGPGERVVTELPSYPGALDAVRAHGGRIVPVPIHPDGGWQVDQLTAALKQTNAKLAYLIPDFHNPTGALVDDDARRTVLRAARRASTTVIVDESFVELGYDGSATPAAAIDGSVITVGSLSKPVWGGMRVGWVRASTEMVHRLAALRTSIDMGGGVLDQLLAEAVFPQLDAVTAARRAELAPRRDALLTALADELPRWSVGLVPRGGLSVWVQLPDPVSTPLALLAQQVGVLLVPGSRFGVDGTLERFVRLPFAQPADVLREAVHRVAGVWDQLGRADSVVGAMGPTRLVVA